MIEAEELSFGDWECFEHMQHQREETRITSPNLDQHSSKKFDTGRNPLSRLPLKLGIWIRIYIQEMVEAEILDFLCLMFETYCTARKCWRKH